MEVIIAIDDLHPEKGWGCEADESIGYLEELISCKIIISDKIRTDCSNNDAIG